jgi:hypothetical protein
MPMLRISHDELNTMRQALISWRAILTDKQTLALSRRESAITVQEAIMKVDALRQRLTAFIE